MSRRSLDEVEAKTRDEIHKHSGCTSDDLKVLLNRWSVSYELKHLLRTGLIRKKKFKDENFWRYYAISSHPLGSGRRLRKRKPVLTNDQAKILRVVRKNRGSTGWKIRALIGGEIPVSSGLPSLIKRGLVRKEAIPGSHLCRYYPV